LFCDCRCSLEIPLDFGFEEYEKFLVLGSWKRFVEFLEAFFERIEKAVVLRIEFLELCEIFKVLLHLFEDLYSLQNAPVDDLLQDSFFSVHADVQIDVSKLSLHFIVSDNKTNVVVHHLLE